MEKIHFYCNECENTTWHKIVAHEEVTRQDSFTGFDQTFEGQILKCNGCDYFSFRLLEHPFEHDDSGKIKEHHYPMRKNRLRGRRFFYSLPKKIRLIYKQTISAYDNELYLLSAMGLRALLESIVTDKIGKTEYPMNLKIILDELKKHFSEHVLDSLQEFRFMGNLAAHELKQPAKLDLHRAINVVEEIMVYFYEIDGSASSFKEFKEKV